MVEMIKTRKLQSHFSTRRAVVEEGGVQPLAKDIITHLRDVEFLNLFPRATFTSETQVKKKTVYLWKSVYQDQTHSYFWLIISKKLQFYLFSVSIC